ncbi:MAG: twin-arginine translocase subunit TatC [Candidatus Dadabacteria bacterium]|nr:twin-arginine translocase subunit TatC [Candidatus Dadabacteria bacterium]NIS07493.1 twin-arginine translocase subunit TatC [Candidatus Dadabacteria bacterium]NIV42841.1 twin-arginine translocase subunit TatC [Candidatus Dadabacteria bacterium]NIX14653.1 twin-arginine translocase subunit TatC [Candidatus Dadabacteria bacterium]NIY21130.1 twin-arginine translocase subunit TatC [Candidatus Dadabacteria bacterium]
MSEEAKMPFLKHIEELRKRLLYTVLTILICFIPSYYFSDIIFDFLMQPLIASLPEGSTMIFTRPAEGFTTYLKIAFFASLFISVPVLLYQAWQFVAPALYKNEKKILLPFIFFGSLFFVAGGAFCYYIASPPAFNFLLNEYSSEYVKAFPSIREALAFFMALILGFGLIFEFPLLSFILARIGVVTSKMLSRNRRYALLISCVIAAILTPTTDALSMMFMFIPLIIFYELGILVAWIFGKKSNTDNFGAVDE